MRMFFTARIYPLALLLCLSGCAGVGEKDTRESANGELRTLTGSEIRRLLTGNTVLGRDTLGPFWMHYPSANTVWGLASNGDVDIGRWWVSGNHYCRTWRRWGGGTEQCWLFASDGSSRLLWIEPDGRSSAESSIEAGNTIGGKGRRLAAADVIGSDAANSKRAPLDETVPVDATGAILIARQQEGGGGREPGGIDTGSGDGGGGMNDPGSGTGGGGQSGGDGDEGAGGDGNAGGGQTGGDGGDGAGGEGDDDGGGNGRGHGRGHGGEEGEGDNGDD